MQQGNDKLTFVLTLALSDTGRDEQDLERAQLLFESLDRFFDKRHLEQLIVVTPGKDLAVVREAIAPAITGLDGLIVDEYEICPEFGNDPDTTNTWPRPNQGWYKQQLIKLAVHEHVKTPFYMTLDSDVIFVRSFGHDTLIKDGMADLNVQTEDDFRSLYCASTAEKEVKVRRLRYIQAESVLACRRRKEYLDQWYGETPVLLNRDIAQSLAQHLERTWGMPWRHCLLDKLPWNEYPVYFLFAEDQDLLQEYYRPGNADTVLRLTESLWQPAEEYREFRDLSVWNADNSFNGANGGVAVVVQSYLGYGTREVVDKIKPLLKQAGTPRQVSVSVIVPVYNVEPYVAKCLDSLVGQDLEDMEVIVVNDGSTDGTLEIVEKYVMEHDAIRLISQQNQGLSAARNAGMAAAAGQYIGFVDGDDWVDEFMYSAMREHALATGADIVIANGQLFDEQTNGLKPIQDFRVWKALAEKNRELVFDPKAEPDVFLLDTSACKRLYRREFLQDVHFQFPLGKIFEDVSTHYELLLRTNRISLLDRPFYFYRTNRPGRITARKNASLLQVFDVLYRVVDDLEKNQVSERIWANFIWFQNWVLRWLRRQIDPEFSQEFDRKCVAISRHFSTEAVTVFRDKFSSDRHALEFVTSQLENSLAPVNMAAGEQGQCVSLQNNLHLGNDPEGVFNPDPNTYMPDIWGWVCLQFDIRSVLDIGCGMGTNLSWFSEYGFEVLGVEGHPNAVAQSLVPQRTVLHDFTKGPWRPEQKFDLCLCTEFAEHVEAVFEDNWMVAVDQCRYLLLAAAPPGQGGYHHVNEQPDEYWIKRFAERGFSQDAEITKKLRATCNRKPAPWGRNTLMFFENVNQRHQPVPSEINRAGRQERSLPGGAGPAADDTAAALRRQNDMLKKQLSAVYSSRSWKMTGPFRWLLDALWKR